jgi:hypothetical protein
MSTGELPDKQAGVLLVSGEEPLLETACADAGQLCSIFFASRLRYIQAIRSPSSVEPALCP